MKKTLILITIILLIGSFTYLFSCSNEIQYTAEEWESISSASETTITEKTVSETVNNQLIEELEKVKMAEEIP